MTATLLLTGFVLLLAGAEFLVRGAFESLPRYFYVVLFVEVQGNLHARLHNVSKTRDTFRFLEQPNCRLDHCGRQVHVALCRGQVGVPSTAFSVSGLPSTSHSARGPRRWRSVRSASCNLTVLPKAPVLLHRSLRRCCPPDARASSPRAVHGCSEAIPRLWLRRTKPGGLFELPTRPTQPSLC